MMRAVAGLGCGLGVALLLLACDRPQDRVSLEEAPPVPEHCDVLPPPDDAVTVQVVFSCDEASVGTWRSLPAGESDTLRFALEMLLQGPTPDEEETGLSSFFSSETAGMIRYVRVQDGVAFIDFDDFSRVIPNASTSAGSHELLDQIAGTVFQFDSIREAELSFNGNCAAFWNWLQRDCQRLTRVEH